MTTNRLELQSARMVVVGLGLMGGSFALAASTRCLCRVVNGVDVDPEAVEHAIRIGAISTGTTDLASALSHADIIVLSTPVRTIIDHLRIIGETVTHPCVVLDFGSTKQEIVDAMRQLPAHIEAVGCHPMCGGFEPGIQHAQADLFVDKLLLICPMPEKDKGATRIVYQIANGIGAKPLVIETNAHDQRVAAVSHFPYFLSVLLMQVVETIAGQDEQVWQIAAGGFARMSSLALGSEAMWADIFLTNRTNMLHLLTLAKNEIDGWEKILENSDEHQVYKTLHRARQRRLLLEDK